MHQPRTLAISHPRLKQRKRYKYHTGSTVFTFVPIPTAINKNIQRLRTVLAIATIPALRSVLISLTVALFAIILSTQLHSGLRERALNLFSVLSKSTPTAVPRATYRSTSSVASPNPNSNTMTPKFLFRPSEQRGAAVHPGFLRTFHTFSFADYYDPRFEQFGALRVINEDRVTASTGFPTHPHREAEIFSYVVSGELAHKDSMGNVETMKRGDIQMTSGGSGIRHSEYNDNKDTDVHFLQIWALPEAKYRGKKPEYFTRHFTDAQKQDKWAHIVAPIAQEKEFGVVPKREAEGPTPIHSSVNVFASLISSGNKLEHALVPRLNATADNGKLVYVQLVQTTGYNPRAAPKDGSSAALIKVTMGDQEATLGEGDGVFITSVKVGDNITVDNVGSKVAEVLLFEMDA